MDPIGIIAPPITAPALPVLPQSPQQTSLPDPSNNGQGNSGTVDQVQFDAQLASQKRYEAVQRMAQQIANIYVVSDRRFTIFKDVTGQYITRFTSLRDGKVTYIPEPELFRIHGAGDMPSLLKVQA